MNIRLSPHVQALIGSLAFELGVWIATADDQRTIMSRLPYFVAVPVGIFVLVNLLRPLIRRQVVLMGTIQAVIGVLLTIVGAQANVTAQPFDEPISTGFAFAGPALVMSAIYIIVADLRQLDIKMVAGPRRGRRPIDREWTVGPSTVHYRQFSATSPDPELLDDCRNMLSARSVHFVALFVDGEAQCYLDVLPQRELRDRLGATTPDGWRDLYERSGLQLIELDRRMSAGLGRVLEGKLVRTVMDVKPGGLFLYRLDEQGRTYLLGATLVQNQILLAQHKLDVLARKHQRWPNGKPEPGTSRARDLETEYPVIPAQMSASKALDLMREYVVASVLVDLGGRYVELTALDLLRAGVPDEVRGTPSAASHYEDAVLVDAVADRAVAACLPPDPAEVPVVRSTTLALEVAGLLASSGSRIAAVVNEHGEFVGAIRDASLLDRGANV